ncbi:MAG: ribosome maturation factor RimM [Candidatus Nanopelagicaceae bacterium]
MLLVIGRIGRAHGLRGEVTVESLTDKPEVRFQIGNQLQTDPSDRGPLLIETSREHNGVVLLSFKGKSDRNAAESLRGTKLLAEIEIPKSTPDSNEFHISQIVGMKAKNLKGDLVGIVVDVLDHPAHDTLVVKTNSGEILIPFVTKHVPTVGTSELIIDNLEGIE